MALPSPQTLMSNVQVSPLPAFVELPVRCRCVACQEVLIDPWQTECGHRICSTCMDKLFSTATKVICPAKEVDCLMLSRDRMCYDRGMCHDILRQKVYCTYKDAGCIDVMKWSSLSKHLLQCEYCSVDCPHKQFGCREKVPKKHLDSHSKRCQYFPECCPKCGAQVGRSLLKKVHFEKDCPEVQIKCPYGCGRKTRRHEMEIHKRTCDRRPKQCPFNIIGCIFEGSESDVEKHVDTAHEEHFDFIVRRIEEVDLKRVQLETKLEEEISETELVKRKLGEANQKISQQCARLTTLQAEVDQLKAVHETFATREEFQIQQRYMEEVEQNAQNQIIHVEERVSDLERDNGSSGGGLSGETQREIEIAIQQIGVHDIRLAEMDVRFQCLETANYEGVLVWKVTEYTRRKQDAFQGTVLSLYSQPFYTSRYGYKMCGRVYLNGDGMGRGTHLSLFFVLMRGEYDALLDWPFRQKVTLSLLDQSPARRDISDTFRPDPTSSSFRRPTTEMNIASGCPMFILHQELQNSRFLKDDTIYMKIVVDTTNLLQL